MESDCKYIEGDLVQYNGSCDWYCVAWLYSNGDFEIENYLHTHQICKRDRFICVGRQKEEDSETFNYCFYHLKDKVYVSIHQSRLRPFKKVA